MNDKINDRERNDPFAYIAKGNDNDVNVKKVRKQCFNDLPFCKSCNHSTNYQIDIH